ncbi:hypothetical protein AZI86_02565 [Bdellovibrio bacteriovorus]|uniref:Uncharacterized protein n=1 Tax=Bdellovibrio bacteriovorus TaxID=959 RepID=A0A150WNI1_BDEBC|nr:hypothetical protein [Bdellovibrio bacteriovorus]KYG65970.1 hypothetical protein AZI86_02565 [Bdellovibrio bacteriovorus]
MKKIIVITMLVVTSVFAWAQKDQKAEESYDKPPVLKFGDWSNENEKDIPMVPTHISKGEKVEVLEYDVAHDVFSVATAQEREQGPFYFTPEELLKGTGFALQLKDFSKQKKLDFVGSEHVLKSDIRILEESEYRSRLKK